MGELTELVGRLRVGRATLLDSELLERLAHLVECNDGGAEASRNPLAVIEMNVGCPELQ